MMLLQVGNGMQGTLLGIRGVIEGFSTLQLSIIMSWYFVGFLVGSRMAPGMIRRVGHVRVFAALGSMISAMMILYPTVIDPWAWSLFRAVIGFCFAGVYVTAESWLNNSATNETRGKALSLYMIVQMVGLVSAQAVLVLADPAGYVLFVIPCVLVSLAFAPILLSVGPTPSFDTTKPLSLLQIMKISPLGCVGMLLTGGVFAAQFGMAAIYGSQAGLSVAQISTFVAAFYVAALVAQYPAWLVVGPYGPPSADRGGVAGHRHRRDDRHASGRGFPVPAAGRRSGRRLVESALFAAHGPYQRFSGSRRHGGRLGRHGLHQRAWGDCRAAHGGLDDGRDGAGGYFLYMAILMFALVAYAIYRMTRRAAPDMSPRDGYAPVMASSSPIAVEYAQEVAIEAAQRREQG